MRCDFTKEETSLNPDLYKMKKKIIIDLQQNTHQALPIRARAGVDFDTGGLNARFLTSVGDT